MTQELPFLLSGRRILVVDDDEISRLVACEILNNLGATVDLAILPDEAMQLVRSNQYDLIILDMHMPGMNGIELANMIISLNPSLKNKIVILTAINAENSRREILNPDIPEIIPKPLDTQRIIKYFNHCHDTKKQNQSDKIKYVKIDGINISDGIKNFMGNEQSFFFTLQAFPEYGRKFIEDYSRNIEMQNIKECWRLAHSLKGSSAMIGATSINILARQLESLCSLSNDLPDIDHLFQKIKTQILKTNKSILGYKDRQDKEFISS